MDWKKRVYCGDVSVTKVGDEVLLMGWVDAIRDHGHILFIHLRDLRGIVQVVFDSKKNNENYKKAHTFRDEYIIEVRGEVALRAPSTKNPNLQTGEVEVFASELSIIAKSKKLPFNITEKAMVFGEEIKTSPQTVNEDLRLQYRYLDLRRPSMQEHFVKRYEIIKCIREYLDKNEFIELDTPVLTMSTPEGARDYLVPSRVHRGTFYALPQSPQIFKQLFMISGIDRYFQIVKCFRDEDLRPNRQPEFTQLDMEASFIDEKFIYEIIEGLTVSMFFCDGIKLKTPFPTMTYNEAMNRYGTDRPDVRFEMAFEDITDVVKNTKYGVFRRIIKNDGNVKGFCVRGQAERLSKNVLQNEYSLKIAPSFGAKGMSWMKVVHGKLESNIVQFFDRSEQEGIIERFGAKDGDVIIMIADSSLQLVNNVLGRLRLHIAERYSLIPSNTFCPLWVTEFPMFELDGEKLSSMHHPFTMPDKIDFDPEDKGTLLKLKSRAYDLVMNGEELGGGSVRINSIDVQRKVFQALGLSEKEVQAKFGFFLRALEYGAPPHAGLALGLDRVLAMILNLSSIRDVIPFPKNRNAVCPLTSAPSYVDSHQIKELGLDVDSIIKNQKKSNLKTEQENDEAVDSLDVEKITEDEVKHIARLARLELNESEIDSYKKDINTILKYVDILNELNTEKIEPMRHVLNVKNVWREDEPGSSKMAKTILTNAPVKEDNYFKVPKILEG